MTTMQQTALDTGRECALRGPVLYRVTGHSYHCDSCGRDMDGLTEAEVDVLEYIGHCMSHLCPSNRCEFCDGERGWVSGEDWVACRHCAPADVVEDW